MILFYTYEDVGAQNALKKMKYSMLHARAAIENDNRPDVKIHVDYIRSLGRNPQFDISSLYTKSIIDSVEVKTFDHSNLRIDRGWPRNSFLCFLDFAEKSDDQVAYVLSDVFFHSIVDIPQKEFAFWGTEDYWKKVIWGFPDDDVEVFFDYCHKNGLAKKNHNQYIIYNTKMVHIPKKHIAEFQEKFPKMLRFIIDMYKHHTYTVTCSIAISICASIITSDIIDRTGQSVELLFTRPNVTSYISERETDVAGSLRLFFE